MPSGLETEENRESVDHPYRNLQIHNVPVVTFSRASDPLVHHGRHFGRTVHAMCNVQALVTAGILRMADDGEVAEESLTPECVTIILVHFSTKHKCRARKEYRVFEKLLRLVPNLTEHLVEASEEESMIMADLVCRSLQ